MAGIMRTYMEPYQGFACWARAVGLVPSDRPFERTGDAPGDGSAVHWVPQNARATLWLRVSPTAG
jgi:hypothetical protein